MTVDPLLLMPELERAADRLLRTAAGLDEAALAEPSLLPGWSRGHVLAHLARNADSYVNLLTAARTGEPIPAYPSEAARAADIEAGAARPPGEQLADLRAAAERFAHAVAMMPAEAWAVTVTGRTRDLLAATLVWGRLREIEVHHVDLAAGYRVADWPDAFSLRLLHEVATDLAGRPDGPAVVVVATEPGHRFTLGAATDAPTVTGPAYALAGWLTGRGDGDGLAVTPDGPLPIPPNWI
ncbi:maleylpyruvate isomerase family mycothiol-dependent enzyme [Micromonospora sp. NPDC049559]|uniref:maleylpyruvate isomerase family mycothiol-dependent enzyme n=1 Tax=Micromonospora sp. NPDC049559 TaxID=3155923 RepID=UPI0034405A79